MAEAINRFNQFAGYSVNTMKLITFLEERSEPGTRVSDDELMAVSNEDCSPSGPGYGHLQSAIRFILRSKSMLWSRVKDAKCIVCLNDSEKVDHCKRERKLIHRRSKRTMQKLATVDTSKLDDGGKTEHLALTACMGTLSVFSSAKTQDKMISGSAYKPLEIGKALEMMK